MPLILEKGVRLYMVRNRTRVELSYGGSGLFGEYDPTDKNDIPLLRLTLYRDGVNICSILSRIPATMDERYLYKFISQVMEETFLLNEGDQPPAILEYELKRLGWVGPEPEKEVQDFPQLLLGKVVAKSLEITVAKLTKLIEGGNMVGYKIGKTLLVEKESVIKYLENQKIKPNSA